MISIIKHVTLVVSEKHGKQRNWLNQLDEDLWSCRGTNLRHLFHPRIILRGVFVDDTQDCRYARKKNFVVYR